MSRYHDFTIDMTYQTQITVDYIIDSHGYPSNGWDDPGEGPEAYIYGVYVDDFHAGPDAAGFQIPLEALSQQSMDWLECHMLDKIMEMQLDDDRGADYDPKEWS